MVAAAAGEGHQQPVQLNRIPQDTSEVELKHELIRLFHMVSKSGSESYYNLHVASVPVIARAYNAGYVWPSYRTIQRRVQKMCPLIQMDMAHRNMLTDTVEYEYGKVHSFSLII